MAEREFNPLELPESCIPAYLQYVRFLQLSFGISDDEVKEMWAKKNPNPNGGDE